MNAADQVYPQWGTGAQWEPIRDRCYSAAGVYLALSEELETGQREGTSIPHGQRRVADTIAQLTDAARAVDEFYRDHRTRLDEAAAVHGALPRLMLEAKVAAAQVRGPAAESPFVNYPSVHDAAAAVDAAMVTLESVGSDAGADSVHAAVRGLQTATTALRDALEQAPSRASEANVAIGSVTIRITAVRNKAAEIAPAFSALLREFNAASSADLVDNERESQQAIESANADLDRALAAAAENNPERALELTTSARRSLTEAEQKIVAVTKRLTLLREIESGSQEPAEDVRFRLRHAQMLAVSRGLVGEWGSVLDAQAARIDRIGETLSGRHPDYWAYVRELEAITEFIGGVVDRMRKQPGPRRE